MIQPGKKIALAIALVLFILPSFVSAATFTRSLSLGSSGIDVSALQTFLKDKGFYTFPQITGFFGPVTKDALAKYQASVGLEAVGQVGPKTLALLNGTPSTSAPTSTVLSGLIMQLQQILRLAGFTNITSTGTLDSATITAAQYFASNGDSTSHSSGGGGGGGGHYGGGTDTTAPALSAVSSGTPGQTTTTITWTTDEAATSVVNYGITSSYGSASSSSELSTSHSITLTGLTASTGYHFAVTSVDATGNSAVSSDQTFTTSSSSDTTAPILSSIASSTTATTASITWTTNEAASSQVDYGATSSYTASTTLDSSLVTSHTVTVTGLTASTAYHFRVRSTDASSNLATSSDLTFTTSAAADTTAPVLSAIASSTGATTATITWTTNESATTLVNYGATTAYGTASTSVGLSTSHTILLSGLTSSMLYHYRIQSVDASSNTATSSDLTFTTSAAIDTTAPVISSIATSSVSSTGATVTWTTNENADTRVDYGTTSAYGTASTSATLSTSHSIILSGLTASTLYHYRVQSTDASTNIATSSDLTFTTSATVDTTAPVLSSIATSTTSTTATITWTTNEAASSQVDYGATSSYTASTTLDSSLVTSHTVTVTGLTASTLYHYRVRSADAASNLASSSDQTFTTTATPDTTAPVLSSIASSTTSTTASVTWTTNESATTVLDYGTTSSYGTASTSAGLSTSHTILLSGLAASTQYHYRVQSVDASSNVATSSDLIFTTSAAADTTAPVLSAIASSTAATTATITWTTNENANTRVDYGATSAYGTASTSAALSTSHSILLSGLTSSTVYHFRVQSADASANIATSSDLTFTTSTGADVTGPVITSIASSSVSALSATITWTTDEASNSSVQFGTTTAYGTASTSATLTTSHSVVLTGLTGYTTYHFKVSSTDASSNLSSSTDASFTTLPEYVTVLLAGQSNMVGTQNGATFDYAGLDATSTRIFQWSFDGQGSTTLTKVITTASDPLLHPGVAASTRGVGPGMPFARALLPTLASDQKILLVPVAVGGTGLVGDTWASPSGIQYVNAKASLTNVLASTTSARADYILWWQGENDMFYNRSDSAYMTAVDAVFAGFRSVPKAENAKIIIGGVVQEYFTGDTVKQAIQTALANTPLRVANSYFLPPPIGSYTSGDTWHAKAYSQRSIGTAMANAIALPAYYTTNVPATPTATIKGEVVDVTLNGAPAYTIQSRALSSSNAWTETVMYPEATSTHQYIVLPGTGSREAQVVARSYAGSSTPSTLMTFDATAAAAVSVPTPLWDHDYNASPVDGSNIYTSITSTGTDTSNWTNVSSTTKTTINGRGALNITSSVQAVFHTGTIPAGSYTIFSAFYDDYGTSGTQIYGAGILSGSIGISLSRGLLTSANIGSFQANHNNSGSPVWTNPFDLRRPGYITVASVFDSTTNIMKIYVNGQLFKSGTIAARTQTAPSTKAWNQLSDGRTDAFNGAKLAWKVWSSALTQDQIIKVQNDVKDAYGITYTN